MLSQKLKSLADRLREYADTGVEMNASATAAIVAVLDAAVDDAEELEGRVVPPNDRLTEGETDNVVRLRPKAMHDGGHAPEPEGAA